MYGSDSLHLTSSTLYKSSLILGDLASASGLAVHASGGIIASSAGVTGTGKITLPTPIDPTKPFRVHLKFELNSDTTNNLFLQLGSTGTPPFWSGCRAVVIKAGGSSGLGINVNTGLPTIFNDIAGLAAIPAATSFWLSICGDGQYVTVSLIPSIASGSFGAAWNVNTPGFQASHTALLWKQQIITDVSSGANQFTWGRAGQADQLTQIYFQTSSITTRFIGCYVNVGSLEGQSDTVLGTPMVMALSNSQDNTAGQTQCPLVVIPPNWNTAATANRAFVMWHHPNGNPSGLIQSNNGPTGLALYFANYAQGTTTGCQVAADFSGATSSCWGAPTGLQYRKNFLDYIRNSFNFYGKLFHLGMSMGLMNAVAFIRDYGDGDAVVGVSGACDLTDSFNNRGFSTIINNAYGAWYRSLSVSNVGNTPETSPASWRRMNVGTNKTGLATLNSPYSWKDAYAAGTTYSQNDVVFRSYAGGITALGAYDPVLSSRVLAGKPIKLWHGDSDVTIPASQATSLVNAVNANGGTATLVTVVGGTHLGATMYDPTNIVAFFDAN